MSLHRSLRNNKNIKQTQRVKTRWGRIQRLRDKGRWKVGDSIYGLPK